MANTKSKTEILTLASPDDPAASETAINALIEAQEAGGWVCQDVKLGPGKNFTLFFLHQNYLSFGGALAASASPTKVAVLDITDADLNAAATSQALPLPAVPAKCTVIAASVDCTTAFTGGGATTCTAEVGDVGDPDGVMQAASIFTTGFRGLPGVEVLNTKEAFAPEVTITSDVNVNTLTTGAARIALLYQEFEAA